MNLRASELEFEGFRVQGLGFRVIGFRVQFRFRV